MTTPTTQIIGTYVRTIRKDFYDGYTVFYITCKGYDEYKVDGKILCTGKLPITTSGVPLKLIGFFEKTEKPQYIFNVHLAMPYSNKKTVTCEYILNMKIKGIGPKTAEKIVDVTGADIFEFAQQDNAEQILTKSLKEIKQEKIQKLLEIINETHFEKKVYEFIQLFGGNYVHAQNVFEIYKINSINELKTNPYQVGKEADIPFSVCDAIARSVGIMPFDRSRVNYLTLSALYMIANTGNTHATIKDIYEEVQYVVQSSAYPEYNIPCSLVTCVLENSQLVKLEQLDKRTKLYVLKEYAEAENIVAQNIVRIINSKKSFNFDIEKEIETTENKLTISYSEQQKNTFNFLKTNGIKILTGGPGTGKTTVVNGLIDMYKRLHPQSKVVLCAPTGRASQKIKSASILSTSL